VLPGWWKQDGRQPVLKALLSPAEALFRAGVAMKNAYMDASGVENHADLPIPVVSVGSLTVGGAGKTPAALKVVHILEDLGKSTALIFRGYKSMAKKGRGTRLVTNQVSWQEVGDEAFMAYKVLKQSTDSSRDFMVLADPSRAGAVQEAARMGAQVAVLDDGFQHRKLHRDLDILVLDALYPFGNHRMLPAGPLREPIKALKRADIIWIAGTDRPAGPMLENLFAELSSVKRSGQEIVMSRERLSFFLDLANGKRMDPGSLAQMSVFLVAGIAVPEKFEKDIRSLGLDIKGTMWFQDHHSYSLGDWQEAVAGAQACGAKIMITTQKDAVKIEPHWVEGPGQPRVLAGVLETRITDNYETIRSMLLELFDHG